MRIRVRYFSNIRERTGVKEEELELPEGATAENLITEAKRFHPNLGIQEQAILVSVNGGFVESSTRLKPGDDVALFPPVSGG